MQRKKKRFIRGIIVIILFLFVVAFGFTKLYFWIQSLLKPEELELNRLTTIDLDSDINDNVEVFTAGSHLCQYLNDKLNVYNHNGALLWEKNIDAGEINIKGNDNLMVVADIKKGFLHFFDYKGNELDMVNTESEIDRIKILTNNYIAVSLKENNSILIFDEQGKGVAEIQIPKGIINDFDISNNGNTIGVVLLTLEEYEFYSNILLFSLDGRVLVGNKVEDSILYFIKADDSDGFLVIGDNRILTINKDKGIVLDKEITETINRINILDENNIVINFTRKNDIILDTKKRNTLTQINTNGEIVKEIPIIEDIINIDAIEDYILAYSERTYFIVDKDGNIIFEKRINKDIKDVFWISPGNFVLVLKDKIEIMTLNY